MSPQPKPGDGRTNKRRRELARAKEARQQARRADREAHQRRRVLTIAGIAALAVVVVGLVVALWPAGDSAEQASEGQTAAASATPSPSGSLAGCKQAPEGNPEPEGYESAPGNQLTKGTDYQLKLTTNCGRIVIDTLPKVAPKTVSSMLWLASKGFLDDTPCHRLTTSGLFVLQCGDPTGTGTGGPGYQVPDENLPGDDGVNYPAGTVAMANSGPGTSGSQFFIVYQDTTLPASYTVWGKVAKGLDVVTEVAAAGVAGGGTDGAPNQPIGILKARPDPALKS